MNNKTMKTYEITATLHDGRVVYENKINAYSALGAIVIFNELHFEHVIDFQSLTVTEVKP